jgi:hypothetical protein
LFPGSELGISKTEVIPDIAFYPECGFRNTLFVMEFVWAAEMIGRSFADY